VNELPFQFEWDEVKAETNVRKHGVTFELASTVFHDPRLLNQHPADIGPQVDAVREPAIPGGPMSNQPIDNDIPAEIDFGKGVRGLHHIPLTAKVLMAASIEKSVWAYYSGKAEERGILLSELLTEVLKRDIEIHEALK
jgi:hypothetical protein